MFWDDLMRKWRRAGVISPHLLRAAGGHVAVLPTPRRRRRPRLLLLLLALVAIGAVLLVGTGRVRVQTGEVDAPGVVASRLLGG